MRKVPVYKSEFTVLDECRMGCDGAYCIQTVSNCSKCLDCRQQMHVVQNFMSVGRSVGRWLHGSMLNVGQAVASTKSAGSTRLPRGCTRIEAPKA